MHGYIARLLQYNHAGTSCSQMFTMMVSTNCKDTFILSTQNFKTQRNFIGQALKNLKCVYAHVK